MVSPVRDSGEAGLPTWADPALVKVLARAFRYKRCLTRELSLISEMAAYQIQADLAKARRAGRQIAGLSPSD